MGEWLASPYFYALLAGLAIAVASGALGCFVVWRRMAYFGDSLAHSALLGIALGLSWQISAMPVVIASSMAFASLLVWLQHRRFLASDTLLGILSHAALSIGMVVASLLGQGHFDIHHYFFGSLLHITSGQLIGIAVISAIIAGFIIRYWSALILMTLHNDLARAEGVCTFRLQWLFMCLMALFVAATIQMVGMLLITALLIIPAATARQWAHSPRAMALGAALFTIVSVCGGLGVHAQWHTPSGPSIVSVATLFFVLSALWRGVRACR